MNQGIPAMDATSLLVERAEAAKPQCPALPEAKLQAWIAHVSCSNAGSAAWIGPKFDHTHHTLGVMAAYWNGKRPVLWTGDGEPQRSVLRHRAPPARVVAGSFVSPRPAAEVRHLAQAIS